MANTLTNLTPDLYEALDTVSRELVGFIPAVSRDSNAERAAKDQLVRSFVAPAAAAADIAPANVPPDTGTQTFTNKTITISKVRGCPVRWQGEEQRAMNTGPGYRNMIANQFAQAMRTLVNEIEADLAGLYTKAGNAIAPADTTLFKDGLLDVARARQALGENGAPMSDLNMVLNLRQAAILRGLNQYAGADTAGANDIVRQGILLDTYGIKIRESGQVKNHVNGTADASTDLGTTNYAIGAKTLALGANGTGTFKAGDVIKVDQSIDANLYVVAEDVADVSTGDVIINAPGLKVPITADNLDLDIQASLERNMVFHRNAIHLVTRAPARPVEGDMADDVTIVQDPMSGLAFEVSLYKRYREVYYEVAIAWGFEMIKPEHCILLID